MDAQPPLPDDRPVPPPPPPPGYGPLPGPPPQVPYNYGPPPPGYPPQQPYYAPPPPRGGGGGVPGIVWIILGVGCGLPLLGFVGLVVAGALIGYNASRSIGGHGGGHAPGVVKGQLAWHEITPPAPPGMGGYSMPYLYESVFAGDLDGDGNDELVLNEAGLGVQIIHLDGSACGSLPAGGTPALCAWDCNGDSKAELIRQDQAGGIEAVDLKGHVVKTFPYRPIQGTGTYGRAYPYIGDADGDGKPELWLSPSSSSGSGSGIIALSPTGKIVATDNQIFSYMNALVCDYDGNGKEVFVTSDYSGGLQAVGVGGTRNLGAIGNGFAPMPNEAGVTACLDVNGDGKPDLLLGFDRYLDHATGRMVGLKRKSSFSPPYAFSGTYLSFDADGDGIPEVVYAGPDAQGGMLGTGTMNGRIYVYQPRTQQTVYDEVIDQGYTQTATLAKSHGVWHLIVPMRDKLEIYP